MMEMHNRVKELTDKIKTEGLDKANKEAERIIEESKVEAEKVLAEAKDSAENILLQAKKDADDNAQRVMADLRMSTRQALLNLKKEISELVLSEVLKEPLSKAFSDDTFIKKMIETVVSNWTPAMKDEGLMVLLPEEKLAEMEAYFEKKTGGLLNNGLMLKGHNNIEKGFEIMPKNGHYKISMTEEAFEAFLKEHLRPKTTAFLFNDVQE